MSGGGSFGAGLRLGVESWDRAERASLLRAQDARAAEAHKQAMEEGGLRLGAMRRTDEATQALSNAQQLGVQDQEAVQENRGLNMADLRRAEASMDGSDYGQAAPNTQVGGLRQEYRAATDRDLNRLQANLAAAKGDVQGMETMRAARKAMDINDISANVMKMPIAEIEKMAPDINASGYPMLYTGKGKDGYTFLKTEADGKTPIAGSQFALNENQLRQLALAHHMGDAGFGTEAMAALSAAHKDIGDHVSKWNDAMSKSTTANNTATHYGNQDSAAMLNAKSAAGLRATQAGAINSAAAGRQEAADIAAEYDALTPEEQAGQKGVGLIRRFNMANVKAGGQVSLAGGGKVQPELTKLPEDDTRVRDSKGNVYTYKEGQPILPGGYAPSQRAKLFASAGLPAQAEDMLQVLPGGKYVQVPGYNNDVYDLSNPGDVKLIKQAIASASSANVAARELSASGFVPRRPQETGESVHRARASEMGRNREETLRRLGNAHNQARSQ